jgi:hypothetical protein
MSISAQTRLEHLYRANRNISVECCSRNPEAIRYLNHADIRIGEHRLGGLELVVHKFRRTASRAASAPCRG